MPTDLKVGQPTAPRALRAICHFFAIGIRSPHAHVIVLPFRFAKSQPYVERGFVDEDCIMDPKKETTPTPTSDVLHDAALSKARFTSDARPKTYATSWNNPSVPIPEGRHSVVQRKFRLFIRSGTYGTMRPWLTLPNHANTIRRMEQCQEDAPTRTRATIRLTPVLSVLRRQLTGSGRHLTCSVSVALRSTQRSNEATSNALSSVRRRCFTLPTLPRF